jgi:hypothetical protein
MRYWELDDLVQGFRNNVAGHHEVWREAREHLSPDLAVVMGITSVAAETRYFAERSFYHTTKQALADLVLGYAIEEAYVQPNTHYALIYQGDVSGTNFGIKQIIPKSLSLACKAALKTFVVTSRIWINQNGMDVSKAARFYHNAYATIAGYKHLNETGGGIHRGAVPQTFTVEPADPFNPIRNMQFNHRILPPGSVYDCYAAIWDELTAENDEFPAFYQDPRSEPQFCSATPEVCSEDFKCDAQNCARVLH